MTPLEIREHFGAGNQNPRDALMSRAEAQEWFKTHPPCFRCGKHHAFTKEDYDEMIHGAVGAMKDRIDQQIADDIYRQALPPSVKGQP